MEEEEDDDDELDVVGGESGGVCLELLLPAGLLLLPMPALVLPAPRGVELKGGAGGASLPSKMRHRSCSPSRSQKEARWLFVTRPGPRLTDWGGMTSAASTPPPDGGLPLLPLLRLLRVEAADDAVPAVPAPVDTPLAVLRAPDAGDRASCCLPPPPIVATIAGEPRVRADAVLFRLVLLLRPPSVLPPSAIDDELEERDV